MLALSTMGKRISTAALLLLLGLAPAAANADVTVAEPTGDAEPAFLAELKASLETVAAEAAPELNAELRASATVTETGVELVVELAPNDGSAPIRETRTASKASALAQARAMGRAAVKALATPKLETVPALQKEVTPPAEPPKPPPLLRERYSRRIALTLSVLPTCLFLAASWGVGFIESPELVGLVTLPALSLFVSFAPAIGYFYLGKTGHGFLLSGIRVALGGAAIISGIVGYNDSEGWYDTHCNIDNPSPACDDQPASAGIVAGFVLAILLSGLALVDASLVGRAADRANEQWRDKNKLTVTVAPVAWPNGHGNGTFGLAVSGTF